MKTIQMTIDEPLLNRVNQVIQTIGTTRSAFIRNALELALQRYEITQLEKKHEAGYKRYPVQTGEFDGWEQEQAWGDE